MITKLTTMLLLIHIESQDIDLVEKCNVEDNTIHVNFGMDWWAEFPADEYKCSTYQEVKELYETK